MESLLQRYTHAFKLALGSAAECMNKLESEQGGGGGTCTANNVTRASNQEGKTSEKMALAG